MVDVWTFDGLEDGRMGATEAPILERRKVREVFLQIASVVLLIIGVFAVVYAVSPGVRSALSTGHDLVEVEPSPAFTSKAHKGDVIMAVFTIKNVATRPITLLGATSGCSCAVAEGLPLKLAPGETGHVSLRVTVGSFDKAGVFAKSAELFTNLDGTVPPMVVRVSSIDTPKDS
jgi:hypothetical protein